MGARESTMLVVDLHYGRPLDAVGYGWSGPERYHKVLSGEFSPLLTEFCVLKYTSQHEAVSSK
jgi:hypothetical protein